MIEVRLETEPTKSTLIAFDGRVVELFDVRGGTSSRFHVSQIAKIEIVDGKQGKRFLNMTSKYVNTIMLGGFEIHEQVLRDTQELVAAVQRAMSAHND